MPPPDAGTNTPGPDDELELSKEAIEDLAADETDDDVKGGAQTYAHCATRGCGETRACG